MSRRLPARLPPSRPTVSLLPMPRSFAAILFDFDGVIVHSEPLHYEAFREVLADEGIILTKRQYYADLIGFDDRGFFQHFFRLRNQSVDAKVLRRLMTRKGQVVRALITLGRYAALPGATELIHAVSRNHGLAICSGARRREVESMLDALGLREFFPIIVAAEDVSVGKPDPAGYLLAAKLVGKRLKKTLEPADCLIIEDAPSVAANAVKAGFTVLGVTTSCPADTWDGASAAWVVPNLDPAKIGRLVPGLKLEKPARPKRRRLSEKAAR
jgi:beta-phosphoglucomutase